MRTSPFSKLWQVGLLVLAAHGCASSSIDGFGSEGADAGDEGPAECVNAPCDEVTSSNNQSGNCVDRDKDGFGVGCPLGPDCDDSDPTVAPGKPELCDTKDNDCNGTVDDGADCGGGGTCSDADGDGYGAGCALGADCDDTNPAVNPGAAERCDGVDNNCAGGVDETFDISNSCTNGLGTCEASGTTVCTPDGAGIECGATPGQPTAEVCDRLDNDCNGQIDDAAGCPACIEDGNEPDDSSLTGTSLMSGSVSGHLCPGNADWFFLGNHTAGTNVRVSADFVHASGNINMEMYVGSTYETGSYTTTDGEIIDISLPRSGNVTIRLYFEGTPAVSGNSYTVSR